MVAYGTGGVLSRLPAGVALFLGKPFEYHALSVKPFRIPSKK